jgi:hypothetical protein
LAEDKMICERLELKRVNEEEEEEEEKINKFV